MENFSGKPSETGSSSSTLQVYDEAAAASAANAVEKNPRFERFFNFLSHAALVLGFLGFGWALSAQFLDGNGAKETPRAETGTKSERSQISALSEEILGLKDKIEALQSAAAKNPASDDIHALKKSIDGLKSNLEAVKTETSASVAQIGARFDHAQHEPAAKLQQISDRLDHIEKQVAANAAAASANVPAAAKTASRSVAAVFSSQKLSVASRSLDTERSPQLITNWVVRDVYDGVALVEGEYGSVQVAPGETIPGAGRVKSIERRGNGWIVITSRGLVDSARD